MAIAEGPSGQDQHILSLKTATDLSGKQFFGVKMSADRTVALQSGVTDVGVGILVNKPTSGQTASVVWHGVVKITAGETIAFGNQIRIHSDGKAMVFVPDTDVTAFGVGVCILGAASGELIEAIVNFASPDRGEE